MTNSPGAGGRRFLLAGFGGLLLLMLVAGVDALVVLREIRSSDAHERELYLRRSSGLDRTRGGIYESVIVTRDYLESAGPKEATLQLDNLEQIHSQTDRALSDLATALEPAENAAYQDLSSSMGEFWKTLERLTRMPERERRVAGVEYLRMEVLQRRAAALDLVDRVDRMDARQFAASEASLSQTFDRSRRRLIAMLLVTITAGLLLATFTFRRTLRLETELEARYRDGIRAQQELKELSARLVSAQEEERRAISRELHDEVGQSLSALLMEAGNAAARVPPSSVEARRHVESIKKLAESCVNVIRNMTLLLRPSMLDDFGLVPALEWQAREVYKRTGLRVHVSAGETAADLPDAHKTCIYRVVQEALHNCARHAHARSVNVTVQQEPDRILLSVEDDGRGFDSKRVRGLGLVGMEERVNHLGGDFEVKSAPGGGTTVAVKLPLAS